MIVVLLGAISGLVLGLCGIYYYQWQFYVLVALFWTSYLVGKYANK